MIHNVSFNSNRKVNFKAELVLPPNLNRTLVEASKQNPGTEAIVTQALTTIRKIRQESTIIVSEQNGRHDTQYLLASFSDGGGISINTSNIVDAVVEIAEDLTKNENPVATLLRIMSKKAN